MYTILYHYLVEVNLWKNRDVSLKIYYYLICEKRKKLILGKSSILEICKVGVCNDNFPSTRIF